MGVEDNHKKSASCGLCFIKKFATSFVHLLMATPTFSIFLSFCTSNQTKFAFLDVLPSVQISSGSHYLCQSQRHTHGCGGSSCVKHIQLSRTHCIFWFILIFCKIVNKNMKLSRIHCFLLNKSFVK